MIRNLFVQVFFLSPLLKKGYILTIFKPKKSGSSPLFPSTFGHFKIIGKIVWQEEQVIFRRLSARL